MNDLYKESMGAALDRLEREKQDIAGVVVTSAKKTFFAGGNLKGMMQATPQDAPAIFAMAEEIKAQLRRLETLGKPVVAALNGSALGGGLEIALACHHRIAVDDPKVELGLPEVTLGLLPGGGGVTRTVRMLGLSSALLDVLLQGPRMKPAQARDKGLVHELVERDDLVTAAKAWVKDHQGDEEAATQPWDRPGYKMPGGTPSSPKLAAFLPAFPANLRKQLKGAHYPAPRAILAAAVEGAQVDFDTATRIESRYFTSLVTGQNSKNMIQAFFFDLQAINSGSLRPDGHDRFTPTKLGVLGAGMMGAGIAYSAARSGVEVVLKDVSVENAEKGKGYSVTLLDKAVERGKLSAEQRDEVLARIHPTAEPGDLAGCDLVIEAVFEDPSLKNKVFGEVLDVVDPDALLCSNTSTLPITELAEAAGPRAESFIGLHFFSPVDKMPLVEIIRGKKTSDATVARAVDVVQKIRKTPIVVNDSRGFYTSRVYGTLLNEAVALLEEGVDPQTIERAATMAGFPAPPLAMLDEVSLTLTQHIRAASKDAVERAGGTWTETPGAATIDRMVEEFGRKGKAAGAGFYEYPADGKKHLWPGLREHFTAASADVPLVDVQERYLFAMALETAKCFEEGVIESAAAANIGSIMGIGFPPLHGGTVQYMQGYAGGLAGFVARARELAAAYGDRFTPPAYLVELAENGTKFPA